MIFRSAARSWAFSNAVGVIRAGFSGFGRLDFWCRGLRRPRRGTQSRRDVARVILRGMFDFADTKTIVVARV